MPCYFYEVFLVVKNVLSKHEVFESGFRVQTIIFPCLVGYRSSMVSHLTSMRERLLDDRVSLLHYSHVVP